MKRGIIERILNDEKLDREISYFEYSVSTIDYWEMNVYERISKFVTTVIVYVLFFANSLILLRLKN